MNLPLKQQKRLDLYELPNKQQQPQSKEAGDS
jgi:hypothetical protein